MVGRVQKELGPIAVLVNNAGVARSRTLEEITEEDWDEALAVNLKSAFLVTQAVLPHMRAERWGLSLQTWLLLYPACTRALCRSGGSAPWKKWPP